MKAYIQRKIPGDLGTNVAIALPNGQVLRLQLFADSLTNHPTTSNRRVGEAEVARWIETEIDDELVGHLQAVEAAHNAAEQAIAFLIATSS